jgi:hypothetical protein
MIKAYVKLEAGNKWKKTKYPTTGNRIRERTNHPGISLAQ